MTKVAFVKSLPPTMPASEVVAKAKAQGLSLSAAYVYVIRSKAGARKAKPVRRAPQRRRTTSTDGGSAERSFASLVLDLGFARAGELLEQLQDNARKVAFA